MVTDHFYLSSHHLFVLARAGWSSRLQLWLTGASGPVMSIDPRQKLKRVRRVGKKMNETSGQTIP